MQKAWCSMKEVSYYFSRPSIKFQCPTGWKMDDLNPIWVRLLGWTQLSNPSDLPCYYMSTCVCVWWWLEVGVGVVWHICVNKLRPRQDGRHFPDDIFKRIFLKENVWILTKISLKFVPRGPIYNIPALVLIMAWRRPGDKPLSETMKVLSTEPCIRHSVSMS